MADSMSILQPALNDDPDEGGQINVPPRRANALWKVILPGIRCPECESHQTKGLTGKRLNSEGLNEHYRSCVQCETRFRVIYE